MKALSLTQPWATLIAIGAKTIETRSWRTDYRGWLAIHASKAFPRWAIEQSLEDPIRSALVAGGVRKLSELPLGAIVAVVNLHHVGTIRLAADGNPYVYPKEWSVKGNELAFGDYTLGRCGWILSGLHPLREPIPCRGYQGLWDVPSDVLNEIFRQLKGVR